MRGCCDGGKGGGGACAGLKEARFEPLLLIADAVVQAVVATLWTFSMGAVGAGVLLFSAWLDPNLQPHHLRIKDWRYSQAEVTVCDVLSCLIFQGAMCCDDGEGWEREDVLR